ncbi:hypothetical protein Droror1_Dr00021896 [Drosera rotundifolia]
MKIATDLRPVTEPESAAMEADEDRCDAVRRGLVGSEIVRRLVRNVRFGSTTGARLN